MVPTASSEIIWALLAQATLEASNGKNLQAARLFKRAADSTEI